MFLVFSVDMHAIFLLRVGEIRKYVPRKTALRWVQSIGEHFQFVSTMPSFRCWVLLNHGFILFFWYQKYAPSDFHWRAKNVSDTAPEWEACYEGEYQENSGTATININD